MSIIIVGVGQAEFDGESSVPFPAVFSYRTPWHPVPTQWSSCPGMHAVWVDLCALRGCVSTHAGLSLIPRLGSSSQTRSRALAARWSQSPPVSSVRARVLGWPGIGQQALPSICVLDHTHTSLVPTAMVELDGDDVRISSRGKLAERDIVQVKQALPFHSASNRKAL